MRLPILFSIIILLSACGLHDSNQSLQTRIDSLQKKLDNAYKPGLGDFMSDIQVHHNKLWFAGQAQNWKLADFEINEIKEALNGIKQYCTDRPEVKSITMIDPAIDSISNAIQHKDAQSFKSSYIVLTNTCNNCHHATNHEFNVIKQPDTPPFSNQSFKAE